MSLTRLIQPFAIALVFAECTANVHSQTVFTSDFDAGTIPAGMVPGSALLAGVQGYAGLGPSGSPFAGSFLRSQTGNPVTLQLTNLPSHNELTLSFLFAAIDSLDGTGNFPSGDFFHLSLDGVTIFNESFANATSTQIQSYVPPSGVELARHMDLGFSGPGSYYTDSAYNLGLDPAFRNIPHSASSLTLQFIMEGVGVQSLDDESWAMDHLTVSVSTVPEPSVILCGMMGFMGLAFRRSRRNGVA